jgi:U3 small nucleolar ribonucleoprotein protein IMP3
LKTDIRIGPNIATDPAMLITRVMEDHVTWADSSKIKAKV